MLISVIIPAYNYANYIEETINSVLNQTYTNIECIVIDDGSTDNTKDVVAGFLKKDSRLIYFFQENQGLSAARNQGMKLANGDYIAFLDADDLWKEFKIENQVSCLKRNESKVVFSENDYLINDKIFNKKEDKKHQNDLSLFLFISQNPITGSASSIMFSREVYENVGGFDTSLRALEDWDYWFRIAIRGYEFSYCYKNDVVLRKHDESMSKGLNKMLLYHIFVLEKQVALLKAYNIKTNNDEFRKMLMNRIGKIRWYAISIKRKDYTLFSHLIGFQYLKYKYLNKLTICQITKDLFRRY